MIILKILLWIILAILGIVLLILILPISADISYIDGKTEYGVKYAGLPVYNVQGKGIVNRLMNRKKKRKTARKQPKNATAESSDTSEEENAEIQKSAEKPKISEITQPVDVAEVAESSDVAENSDNTENAEAVEVTENPENTADIETKEKNGDDEKEEKQSKLEFILGIWESADRPLLKIFKGIKLSELYIDFIIANEDAYKCALNYGRISGAVYNIIAWLSVLFNVKLKTVDIIPAFAQKKSQFDVSLKISLSLITIVIAGIWFLLIYIFRIFIPARINFKKK